MDYEDEDEDGVLGNEKENEVMAALDELLRALMRNKPNDRSELDKVYAVALTDVRKVYAWFAGYAYCGFPEYMEEAQID